MLGNPTVRFATIGLNHGHIYGMTNLLLRTGAELVAMYAPEPELMASYAKAFPQVRQAGSKAEVLADETIQLVISAGIPNERGPLGVEVMRHGKDYMSDKAGFTTLTQLAEARRVQAETGRIHSICYSERLENKATVKAGELVRAGAIGKVVQTVGLGPHRLGNYSRPDWFFRKEQYGGIITDIASHQFDQFLYFTGSTEAAIVSAQIGNFNNPNSPELEDFGDVVVRGDGGTGYIRVDWFTPDGLPTWGDGRLTILGTQGYIELRKYVDLAGREGGDHLFLVDNKGTHYIDCQDVALPYGPQLVHDIIHRTETAMSQDHCYLAMELALKAQELAEQNGRLTG
ncbi:MAG: Gfo/Idh/MocA family oxidoreductase [Chloroflexota bacterium]